MDRKDLIQVPVYPLMHRHWWNFTANHYADEFAELHGKDVIVREALVGQVPSAGVGTCFSRRAVLHLLDEGRASLSPPRASRRTTTSASDCTRRDAGDFRALQPP